MLWRGLHVLLLRRFGIKAGLAMYQASDIARRLLHSLRKEGVDLRAQQQDDGEIIEKDDQDDSETYLPTVVTEKMREIEGEEELVELHAYRRHPRAAPAMAKRDALIGHNHINGLEKQPRDEQASKNAQDAQQHLAYR